MSHAVAFPFNFFRLSLSKLNLEALGRLSKERTFEKDMDF